MGKKEKARTLLSPLSIVLNALLPVIQTYMVSKNWAKLRNSRSSLSYITPYMYVNRFVAVVFAVVFLHSEYAYMYKYTKWVQTFASTLFYCLLTIVSWLTVLLKELNLGDRGSQRQHILASSCLVFLVLVAKRGPLGDLLAVDQPHPVGLPKHLTTMLWDATCRMNTEKTC